MSDLTHERLAELRRIAKDATPGPWAFPHQKDPYGCYLLPLSENNASYIAAFDPTTCLALLDRIEELEAENGELYRRIERLEAKLARQRVALRRLQVAVERRNREERIEALRRALCDETVEWYMRECDAAADEAERWQARYEALRAGVERVAQDLRDRAHATVRDWKTSGHSYHGGASDAYCDAEQMVRRLLDEEGGGDRG